MFLFLFGFDRWQLSLLLLLLWLLVAKHTYIIPAAWLPHDVLWSYFKQRIEISIVLAHEIVTTHHFVLPTQFLGFLVG